MRNAYRVFVVETEGKILLRIWEDSIKMDLNVKSTGMDWIHLIWDRVQWRVLVSMVMNPCIPS
jgi:hypothetical protein